MAIASKDSVHGRMRKRIAVVGRVDRKEGVGARGKGNFVKDRSLRTLLQSGAITREQLENAISVFTKAPSDLMWLADIDDVVLGKAGRVFFVKYGRCSMEDADFRLNGDYHRICRSLQYDLHYYDGQLDELSRADREDVHAPKRGRTEVCGEKPARSRIWAFGAVLVLGFCSAPLLAALIVTCFPGHSLTAGLLLSGLWLGILVGALVLTLPRRLN